MGWNVHISLNLLTLVLADVNEHGLYNSKGFHKIPTV